MSGKKVYEMIKSIDQGTQQLSETQTRARQSESEYTKNFNNHDIGSNTLKHSTSQPNVI